MAKVADLTRAAAESDHWRNLAEFCKWERRAGGPDPHMNLTARMALDDGAGWEETAWRGLCYLGVYNVPCAAAVWNEFPWDRASGGSANFLPWLEKNWDGVVLRRERKCVRSPGKLGRYLASAALWLTDKVGERPLQWGWMFTEKLTARQRYDQGWEDVQRIYAMGRYVAIKFLEYARRHLGVDCPAYDVRCRGGWSPREGLILLHPTHARLLAGDDSPRTCRAVESLARETKDKLRDEHATDLDFYLLQVLLCDYKQCYFGRRQFPGRSQDSEMAYDTKIAQKWGRNGAMYAARRALYPPEVLGEVQGWAGVREDLGDCLAVHGYCWSDFLYDYNASKTDLAHPVARKDAAVA